MTKIIQTNLSFPRVPSKRTSTRHIVIHHRAGTGDVNSLRNLHVNSNKWGWIGYHVYIRLDGSIHQTLPLDVQGIHAGQARNQDSIAICFEGNFETVHTSMPQAQFEAGVFTLQHILSKYNVPISRHRDHSATVCCGKHLPFTAMVIAVNTPNPTDTLKHVVKGGETLTSIANRYNVTVQALYDANPTVTNINIIRVGQTLFIPNGKAPSIFFPATNTGFPSIVNMLNTIGVNNGFANRSKIARANGILNYTGTSAQNTKLANLLKNGKLIKP